MAGGLGWAVAMEGVGVSTGPPSCIAAVAAVPQGTSRSGRAGAEAPVPRPAWLARVVLGPAPGPPLPGHRTVRRQLGQAARRAGAAGTCQRCRKRRTSLPACRPRVTLLAAAAAAVARRGPRGSLGLLNLCCYDLIRQSILTMHCLSRQGHELRFELRHLLERNLLLRGASHGSVTYRS